MSGVFLFLFGVSCASSLFLQKLESCTNVSDLEISHLTRIAAIDFLLARLTNEMDQKLIQLEEKLVKSQKYPSTTDLMTQLENVKSLIDFVIENKEPLIFQIFLLKLHSAISQRKKEIDEMITSKMLEMLEDVLTDSEDLVV
jgi:hypothetical protein